MSIASSSSYNFKYKKTKTSYQSTFSIFAFRSMLSKYNSTFSSYNTNIINNIIYNEKSHIVALFKDYLILDDTSEFLKRYYTHRESDVRLPKFYEYYETYSKIYPNYTSLEEGKYIYRNIQKKQRMIDLQEKMEMEEKKNKKNKRKGDISDEVFSTDVYDSIINDRDTEEIEKIFNIKIQEMETEDSKVKDFIIKITNEIDKFDIHPPKEEREGGVTNRNVKKPNYSKFLSKQQSDIYTNNDNDQFNPKTERTLIECIELNILKLNKKKHTSSIAGNNNSVTSKLSDLKLLYQKNINVNINSNIPLTYRDGSIASETSKSPLTDRTHSANHRSKNANKSNINNTSGVKSNVKNIIYIINQNPKFTTNVNVYNNTARTNRKAVSSAISRSNPKSSIVSKEKKEKIPFTFHTTNKGFIAKKKIDNKEKIKKRNVSATFVSANSAIKTAREIGYKELNLLKASTKSKKDDIAITSRNYNYNYKYNNYLKSKNDNKMSRNVRNSSNEKNSSSKNYVSRNDSLTKLGFIDAINVKKKIKGIQIKNFSKVFNVNSSQAKTDRFHKGK